MSIEQLSAQINSIYSNMSGLNHSLQLKREQLQRLIACQQHHSALIKELETTFLSIRQPELSGNTWAGSNAREFIRIRENEVVSSFQDLVNIQFENMEQQVEKKIQQLKTEVESLETQIAYQRSRLSNLQSERRTLVANG